MKLPPLNLVHSSPIQDALKKILEEFRIEDREKIDQDLADRVSIIPNFLEDVLLIRRNFITHVEKNSTDKMIKEEVLGLCKTITKAEMICGDIYPEDVDIVINEIIFIFLEKYKLPPHFYTWVVQWIDYNKQPKVTPIGWWYRLGRIEENLKSTAGLTTKEKAQLLKELDWYVSILKYTKARPIDVIISLEAEASKLKKQIKRAKGSVHRKKRIQANIIKRQLDLFGQKIEDVKWKLEKHNSKTIALENYDAGIFKVKGEDPTQQDLKREGSRIRKMKSNLKKLR